MNGTAVRLPDQFSPGAAAANAATPTCCCCCCCCAVSSVGAAVHIPAALYQDTKDLPEPGTRSAIVLPAAIFPLLVVVLPFATAGAVFDLHWGWWVGGLGTALAWAVAAGFLARSPKPWASVVRLLGWILLWCLEPFVALPLVAVLSAGTHVTVGAVIYVGGALAFGYWLFRNYRRKS